MSIRTGRSFLIGFVLFLLMNSSTGLAMVRFERGKILINGEPQLLVGGSLQWFRISEELWEDRLRKFKAAGFNCIDLYIPWNVIEPEPGVFNFAKPNLAKFMELAQRYELYVMIRPGPYITNEMDGGGLPAWLLPKLTKRSLEKDGLFNLRTEDPDFIAVVDRYFTALNQHLQPYFADAGGPIILYAIENEYNWFERSVWIDHTFRWQGRWERPLTARPSSYHYIKALRDIVENSGVKVPIIVCPGDGKVSQSAVVERVFPFPNIYEWAVHEQPDEAAWQLVGDIQDADHYQGFYSEAPTGSLEVSRSPQEFRRLLLGGLDAAFAFNVVGTSAEGRQNAILLTARAGDVPPHWGVPGERPDAWPDTIFNFSWRSTVNAWIEPKFGYVGNVIDYSGAISPSGVLNDSFYQFRRDNSLYRWLGSSMAASVAAERVLRSPGSDPWVSNPLIGSRESAGRAYYYLNLEGGGQLLGLVNQTGRKQTIAAHGVQFAGRSLPRFTAMTIPTAAEDRPTYTQLMLIDYPLSDQWLLQYSTAEILGFTPATQRLLAYSKPGEQYELTLSGAGPFELAQGKPSALAENTETQLTLIGSLTAAPELIRLVDRHGQEIEVLMIPHHLAGKVWEVGTQGEILIGPSWVDEGGGRLAGPIQFQFDRRLDAVYRLRQTNHPPQSSIVPVRLEHRARHDIVPDLSSGRSKTDHLADNLAAGRPGQIHWQGPLKSLEELGIYQGTAWYESHFYRSKNDVEWPHRLWVESASDIVSIYLNGQYLKTVLPLGTEIDSWSRNPNYRFHNIRENLKEGWNQIAFKVEVWGHGSFMFGRGHVAATGVRYPGLGYEGLKGLIGRARIGDTELTDWILHTGGVRGLAERYDQSTATTDSWTAAKLPRQLTKGETWWYKVRFDRSELRLDPEHHAPLVLEVLGRSLRGTVFLNGRLIGRWLSDNRWLRQGVWGRPERGVWVALNPDHIPVPLELLTAGDNDLTLLLEDSSDWQNEAGILEALQLRANGERRVWNGNATELTVGSLQHAQVPL